MAGVAAGDSGDGDVVCVVFDGAGRFDDALLMALGDFYASAGDALLEVAFEIVTVDEGSEGVRGFSGVHVGFPFLRGGVTW